MKYILFAILAYILYQFIFKLVVPVYLASKKIKKGFREMHNRMQEQSSDFNQGRQPSAKPETKKKPDDYIDFEEVK